MRFTQVQGPREEVKPLLLPVCLTDPGYLTSTEALLELYARDMGKLKEEEACKPLALLFLYWFLTPNSR